MENKNLENMSKKEFLPICSVCKGIRIIKGDSENWLYKNKDGTEPELYTQLIEKYGKSNLTHTYCPKCYKETEAEIDKETESDNFHW